ncbi:MAG: hypothetical protein RMJ85_16110, partial [Anaerolineales bacterium]|nr:hypothetical protein [Anaerolineales bacterium]
PLPPLSLQEEFARVAARVEGLRRRMDESARQAEGLFQALLSESFAPTQPTPSVLRTPPPNPLDLGEAGWGSSFPNPLDLGEAGWG